jgi:hypothetical protein
LKPKEQIVLNFRFRPKIRLPDFDQAILIQVEGEEEPRKLCSVQGTAHGIELKIMDEVQSHYGDQAKRELMPAT